MSFRRYLLLLPLIVSFSFSPNVLAESVVLSRLSMDYKNYDSFPEASLGLKAGLSWTETANWGARGTAYVLRRFGMTAFQGALGGSYFVTPAWSFDLDADGATNGNILAFFSVTAGTGDNHIKNGNAFFCLSVLILHRRSHPHSHTRI